MNFSVTKIDSGDVDLKNNFFETLNFYRLKNGDIALLVFYSPVSSRNSVMYGAYIFKGVSKKEGPSEFDVYILYDEYSYKECVFEKIPATSIDKKFSGFLFVRSENLLLFEKDNTVILTCYQNISSENTVPGFVLQSDDVSKVNSFNFHYYIENGNSVSFNLLVGC